VSHTKLWTKDFIFVSTINFLLTAVFYLLIVIIVAFAVSEYDASSSLAGLVSGIFIIGTLVGRLFVGRYIEEIGLRRALFIGLILFTLLSGLYLFSINIGTLLLVRFMHGVAMGLASTTTGTIVAQIIPTSRKGEGIGYFSMSATLAAALGPFLGLYLSQLVSYEAIFIVCVCLGLTGLAIAFFVRVPQVEYEEPREKGFKISYFIEPKAFPIAIVVLIVAFCYSSVLSFINTYAEEVNLVEAASFFFLVYSIAILLSRPFTGRLMDVKGANYVMYPAFIIFTAGMLLLSTAETGVTLLLSGALIGLGFGNMQSCTQAIAVKLTPPHRLGLATSTFFIFLDAGLGFGPYLLGFIIPVIGFSSLYVILAFIILGTTSLYYLLYGRKEREQKRHYAA
jgi:MFS family permease